MKILRWLCIFLFMCGVAHGIQFNVITTSIDTPGTLKEEYPGLQLWLDQSRLGSGNAWDLNSDIVARYKLNDNAASTVIVDSEGTNGTLSQNTEDRDVAGKISNAIDFQLANSDFVDCNQTFQTTFRDSFSVAFWLKPDDGQPAAIQKPTAQLNAAAEDYMILQIRTDGKLRWLYSSNANASTVAATNVAVFADGAETWHHIVLVADSTIGGIGGKVIYFDGELVVLDGTLNGSTAGVTFADYTIVDNLYIGAENDNGVANEFFDGPIDCVEFFDKALTAQEISDLFNKGAGTEALDGPRGNWDDLSGKGNNALQGVEGSRPTIATSPEMVGAYRVFDGTDDYLDTGSAFQATFRKPFTIGCWVKCDDGITAASKMFMGSRNNTQEDAVGLWISDVGKLVGRYESNNNSNLPTSKNVLFGNGEQPWRYAVMTVDGSFATIYLDGVEQDTNALGATDMSAWTSSDEIYIGAFNADGTADFFYNGKISDAFIIGRALTGQEIQDRYFADKIKYGK